MRRFCSAILMVATSACSSISINHVDASQKPVKGEPWNLAMTQYHVTITRELSGCTGKLEGKVTVTATAGKALDPQQQYVLYSNPMWATSDITSSLAADGTNTGLNAHAEDQTAQVIANVVTIAADVAKLAAASKIPGPQPTLVCTVPAATALLAINSGLRDRIAAETDALAAATARVTLLTAQATADSTYKQALAVVLGDQATAQSKLNADQKMLAAALLKISFTQDFMWPARGVDFSTTAPFELSQQVLSNWVEYRMPKGAVGPVPALPAAKVFDVSLAIYAADGAGGWTTPAAPASGDTSVGIPVRIPRTGRLLVCVEERCPASLSVDWTPGQQQKLAIQPDQAVLQLGRLYNIPLRGGMFKSEGAIIAIDANGVPTSIEVTEKTAVASAATGALASTLTQASALPAQITQARLTATQAETSQIQAQTALAAAQAAQATSGELSAVQAETTLENAQAALKNADAALAKAAVVAPQ